MSDSESDPALSVLVTGASRGLGREIALAFAADGARVGIGCRENTDAAGETVGGVRAAGGAPLVLAGDLADPEVPAKLVKDFLAQTNGRIDVLVNCAGIFRDRATDRMSDAEWDDVTAVNLDAPYRLIKAAARPMMKQREGHIINIASHAAVKGRAGGANYAAAKAGLIALTKSAARELGAAGVCVNALLPGFLPGTGMGDGASEQFALAVRKASALGKLGDAAEVARFVVHLSTMRHVSGQVLALDSRILPWG